MFSALRQGSPFYVLEREGKPVLKTGVVETVSAPRYSTTTPLVMVVDIRVKINGEDVDFKGVPSTNVIANFGSNNVIISESKEAMIIEVDNMLQSSKKIQDNLDAYTSILLQLNPTAAKEKQRDEAISSLNKRVDMIQGGLDKILAILTTAEDEKIKDHGYTTGTEAQWLPEQTGGDDVLPD